MQWHKGLPDILREQKNGEEHQHSQQSRTSQDCFGLWSGFLHPCVKAAFPQKLSRYPCSPQSRLQEWQLRWCLCLSPHWDSKISFHPPDPAPSYQFSPASTELWLWNTTRESSKICHPEQRRALRIYWQKKPLFSLKFVYSLTWSKLNPQTRCTCRAALPTTPTASQGNLFSHTDEEQLIPAGKQGGKNRIVHNFPGRFQFLWFKLQFTLLLGISRLIMQTTGKVSQALIYGQS